MGELTLDHLRHAALLQHDQHAARSLGQWSAVKVDELRHVEAVGAEIDAIFIDVRAVALDLPDERDERTAEGDDIAERMAAENRRAHLEEVFTGGVDIFDAETLADHEQRMRQGAQ